MNTDLRFALSVFICVHLCLSVRIKGSANLEQNAINGMNPVNGGKPSRRSPVDSFESCLDELEKVVKELEGGDLSLDRSLELFERGMGLSDTCRKQLEEAETRVEMLIRKEGKIAAEPFRPEKSEKA